ncbi:MAG: hypothetical protein WCB78_20165 [Pseudolabrys sp.]
MSVDAEFLVIAASAASGSGSAARPVLFLSPVSLPLGPVSLPPMIQHSAFHAENAGLIYFSNRLRIADVRPSVHFIADDFLRFALKPACALPPLPARVLGVQLY